MRSSLTNEIFSVFQSEQVSRRAREGAVAAMAAAAALLLGSPAEAHMGTGLAGGFASGFNHPLAGFDHLLAMVSVGLWGAFLGRPLIYALPVIFPVVMVGGAVLGMLDVPLPPVEIGIALSVIVLGCAGLLNDRPGGVIATRSAGGVIGGMGVWYLCKAIGW